MTIAYIILGVYVLAMLVFAFIGKKEVKSTSDFVLGGRKIGGYLSAFAFATTYFSAVMVNLAGKYGWVFGVSAVWIGVGNAIIGSMLAWIVLGKKTRRITQELDVSTMPQFLEKRYNSKFLKIYASIIIFVFMVPYSASVYQGLGYIFENAFGLPMNYVLILLAVLTGFYVILGGYISTAKNSLIQGIIIFIGVAILFVSFFNNPDIGGLFQGFIAMAENFGSEGYANVLGTDPALLISLVILTSLGTWGLPQMVHKFYSVDESKINHSAVASTVLALVIAGGFYLMGGFSQLYFLNSGIPVPEDLQLLMPVILENILSPVMFAIVAILLLAASMSTLASLVLVSSSSFIIDLVQELFYKNKEVDEKKTLLWIRITCFIFTILSFAIATTPNTIINLLSLSWGTMAGAFIGPYLWGLYIEDLRKEAAIAASVISVAVMIIGVNVLGAQMTPMIGSAAIFSSLILTVVIHYIIMVFDRRKAYKKE